jgi:hypothetical protein
MKGAIVDVVVLDAVVLDVVVLDVVVLDVVVLDVVGLFTLLAILAGNDYISHSEGKEC